MTNIPSNLLSSTNQVNQITGQAQAVISQVQSISAGAQARLSLIESAIPDSLFTVPTASISLNTLDTPTFEEIESKIKSTVDAFTERVNDGIPELPNITFSGLLGTALNQLPQKIELPNLAEIKEVVYNKLKALRQQKRAAIVQSQIETARLEQTPFTARQNVKNAKNQQILNQVRGLYG
jgi:hypothetical protein